MQVALELREEVLLIAAVIAFEDDVFGRLLKVIGDVEEPRLGEVGVATQSDLAEAGAAAEGHGPIEIHVCLLRAGTIARPIHDVQRFSSVCQSRGLNHVAPLVLVVDVHALLALAGRLDTRASDPDCCDLKDLGQLLAPDFDLDVVEHLLQCLDEMLVKPAAEVASRRRIGDPTGSKSIQIALVGSQKLQVLQPCPTCQQVGGDVQDVIRLVVWQVPPWETVLRGNLPVARERAFPNGEINLGGYPELSNGLWFRVSARVGYDGPAFRQPDRRPCVASVEV